MSHRRTDQMDQEAIIRIICEKLPHEADRLRGLSGELNVVLRSELWPLGGLKSVIGINYIEMIVKKYGNSEEGK